MFVTEKCKTQLDKMDFQQLAEHHNAEYHGIQVYDYDGKKYHTFTQTFEDRRVFTLRIEDKAVKSYTKKGIVTPNEIIHEVFKVPASLRIETREIWFKNTQHGIQYRLTKSGYDTLGRTVGGYNLPIIQDNDRSHGIVINPKYFKGGGKGKLAMVWENVNDPNNARNWKMTIFHEFVHSGDTSKFIINSRHMDRHSKQQEYEDIEKEERGFTLYANTKISESYAEHGGYIAYMESNPSEQGKKITIDHYENGKWVEKKINYEEYKDMYPEHYAYFMKMFKEGF